MADALQTRPAASGELADCLRNRRWLRCARPFPHVIARDVFVPELYSELAAQLSGLLARGLSDRSDRSRFSRGMPGYDAYGIGLTHDLGPPLDVFLSPAWRDLMCGLFEIGPTPYVFGGAHHHAPGSAAGFVHNDFNPVWFPRAEGEEILLPDPAACDFRTGKGSLRADRKVETIRGAVAIFYLLNDGWGAGDGGETGLFAGRGEPHSAAAVRCPPVNNSLVAFECTPRSFHAFMQNGNRPRNSVIVWVHREPEEAHELYGRERVERWKT
jgi:2OG-Fe(II) oxygenase superfamily